MTYIGQALALCYKINYVSVILQLLPMAHAYGAPYYTPLCHNTSFEFHFVAFFAFFFTHALSRNVSARRQTY